MKIYAKKILENTQYDKNIHKDYIRLDAIDNLKIELNNFGFNIINNLDLPSEAKIVIGSIKGFTDKNLDINKTIGNAEIVGVFYSTSGKKVTINVPIVIHYGEFLYPSTCKINGKRYVFSKQAIYNVVRNLDCVTPTLSDIYNKDPVISHYDTVNYGIFQVPKSTDMMDYNY